MKYERKSNLVILFQALHGVQKTLNGLLKPDHQILKKRFFFLATFFTCALVITATRKVTPQNFQA